MNLTQASILIGTITQRRKLKLSNQVEMTILKLEGLMCLTSVPIMTLVSCIQYEKMGNEDGQSTL